LLFVFVSRFALVGSDAEHSDGQYVLSLALITAQRGDAAG
jgi:hypothetical protein